MKENHSFPSGRACMAAMLLAALAGPVAAAPAGAALRYTEVTVTERGGSETGRMVTRTTLDGLRARIDFLAGEEEGAPVVASLVTSDGAKSVAFTEAGKATCSQWDPGELFATVGRLVAKARKIATVKVSGNGVEKLLEEEGPSILGHPTKHIRLRTTYTFKATALFVISYSVSEEVVDDFWVARELKDEPIAGELQKAMSRTGFREIDALIGEAVAQAPGVVVKQETVVDRKGYGGKKSRNRDTVEVTSLEQLDSSALPPDTFSSPSRCVAVTGKEMEKEIIDFAKQEFK